MVSTAAYGLINRPQFPNIIVVANNCVGLVFDFFSGYFAVATTYHRTKEDIKEEYQVIVKAQQDPRYFAPIYERYFDAIFIYVNKRVDNEDISGDITARVFLKCLNNLGKYRYQGVPFSAWLYKIALNEVNQFFRQQKKAQRVVSINDSHIDALIDEMDRKEPEIDKHVLISVLLEQLSPGEIQFLELRFFEGNSFKQIGYLLGITETNAKVKTYRIIDKLRKISQVIKFNE